MESERSSEKLLPSAAPRSPVRKSAAGASVTHPSAARQKQPAGSVSTPVRCVFLAGSFIVCLLVLLLVVVVFFFVFFFRLPPTGTRLWVAGAPVCAVPRSRPEHAIMRIGFPSFLNINIQDKLSLSSSLYLSLSLSLTLSPRTTPHRARPRAHSTHVRAGKNARTREEDDEPCESESPAPFCAFCLFTLPCRWPATRA